MWGRSPEWPKATSFLAGSGGMKFCLIKHQRLLSFSTGNDIQKIELPNWHQDSSSQLEDHLIFKKKFKINLKQNWVSKHPCLSHILH